MFHESKILLRYQNLMDMKMRILLNGQKDLTQFASQIISKQISKRTLLKVSLIDWLFNSSIKIIMHLDNGTKILCRISISISDVDSISIQCRFDVDLMLIRCRI